MRYILAKAYYRLCCELIQTSCVKKDQHSKALLFAVGTGEDIYQHLVKCKTDRSKKRDLRKQREREKANVSRFELLDL